MAAYALLIGTKGSERKLVADGDPRNIRAMFKRGEYPEGFDRIEVIDSSRGRIRSKNIVADKPAKPSPAPPEPANDEPAAVSHPSLTPERIEELKEAAAGDARKASTKAARAELEEAGIEWEE